MCRSLADTIIALEERQVLGEDVTQELTYTYAEMCNAKSDPDLMVYWYKKLFHLLHNAGRLGELSLMGSKNGWDRQLAAYKWLGRQS